MRRALLTALTFLMLVSVCPSALAYEPLGAQGEWDFVVTPYLWLPARSDITSTVSGQTTEMELTFKDVMENFEVFGLSGRFEGWNGRFGLIGDAMWVKINTSQTVALPGPLPVINVERVDIQPAVFDFAGAYRLLQRAHKQGQALPTLYFEPFLGARVVYLKQKIDVRLEPQGPILPDQRFTLGDEKTWAELML
jgi:hypothetical protein